MIKASALYIVMVIALVIGVLCSSLIVVGYIYRLQYQRMHRLAQLQDNLSSGISVILAGHDSQSEAEISLDLFGKQEDTVLLKKISWGVFDVGVVKAIRQRDTLYKTFLIGCRIDSAKWGVLYLEDEDRPVSVGGKSLIKGDAYLPQAGAVAAYVNDAPYVGDKNLVTGKIHVIRRSIPKLNPARLEKLEKLFLKPAAADSSLAGYDSLTSSYLGPRRIIDFGHRVTTLSNISLTGNILLHSDTTLVLEKSVKLNQVILAAKYIELKAGFQGNCQLLATDSIRLGRGCELTYPSCLGIIRRQSASFSRPAQLSIGEQSVIRGLVFCSDDQTGMVKAPVISLAKRVKIEGELYSTGYVELSDSIAVHGSLYTHRFLYRSRYTRYENYIINSSLDESALAPYYLSSELSPSASLKRNILQWLESN